jgi:PAS domain S-box-containing protein
MDRELAFVTGRRVRFAAATLALVAASAFFTLWTARQADSRMRANLLGRARLGAHGVNIEEVRALSGTSADLEAPAYLRLKRQLAHLRHAASDCRFVYVMGQRPDGTVFFFADCEPVGSPDESPAGQTYEEASDDFRAVFATGVEGTEGPTEDRWGTWVSASIPMKAAETGKVIAVFGMDVDASDWKAEVVSRCWLPVGLLAIILLTGGFTLALLVSYRRLRASREHLTALESVVVRGPAVLFLWRVVPGEWPVELVSGNVERVFGHRAEDLVSGRVKWATLTHPDDASRLEAEVAGYLSRGVEEWSQEYRLFDGQGRTRWVRDWNRVVRDAGGEVAHIQAIALDITDLRQAEREKEKLQAQLSQAQKMELVGRLAGGVAHDFNNLLMGMMGYVDMCREELEPGHPVQAYLDEIMTDAERSAELTRQLLAFARKQIIAPTVLDVNAAAEEILKLLRRLVGEGVHVTWAPTPDLWRVKLDRSQLEQVLGNLVVNARDAIKGSGKVTIETANVTLDAAYIEANAGAEAGEFVLLAVTDSGSGMDKETLSHLFEPFFTTKELGHGTGLGLATVYGIVKQNRGFIKVYSEVGKGTTFKVYIPRFVGEDEKVAAAPSPSPHGTETILLAEDERSLRVTTQLHLEDLGYKVLAAGNGEGALALAKDWKGEIHLLLTDVIMPGKSGRELAERLHAVRPGVKCLYMSGYTANVIAHHGVLEDGVSFISKPCARNVLARKVRDVLDA